MRPQYQLIRGHDPKNGVYGDCFRTVIACLLNMPPAKVPHTCEGDSDTWLVDMNAWLAQHSLNLLYFGASDPSAWHHIMAGAGQELYHLITVAGPTEGIYHAIVGRNGKPFWCPIHGDVQDRDYEMFEFAFLVFTSL